MHKNHVPLYAKHMMVNHANLFKAALRQFGSWAKALVATGITKKPRTKKLYKGRLSLLNALSDALERHTVENVPQALKLKAAHYFGSFEKAIAALKKHRNQLPGWNSKRSLPLFAGYTAPKRAWPTRKRDVSIRHW